MLAAVDIPWPPTDAGKAASSSSRIIFLHMMRIWGLCVCVREKGGGGGGGAVTASIGTMSSLSLHHDIQLPREQVTNCLPSLFVTPVGCDNESQSQELESHAGGKPIVCPKLPGTPNCWCPMFAMLGILESMAMAASVAEDSDGGWPWDAQEYDLQSLRATFHKVTSASHLSSEKRPHNARCPCTSTRIILFRITLHTTEVPSHDKVSRDNRKAHPWMHRESVATALRRMYVTKNLMPMGGVCPLCGRQASRRWNPDKFQNRYGHLLHPEAVDDVLGRVNGISQQINHEWQQLQA